MQEMLSSAGFSEVAVQPVRAQLRLSSANECVRFERESFGALQQMLAPLPVEEQEVAWDEIEQELRAFEGDKGFDAPAELILGAGTK